MQFHLNGFKPGNYQVPDATRAPYPNPPVVALPPKVDVLIVGCGPAGLAMARQMSEFPEISTCIVDQKPGPLLFGQADGISCRTMEIMEGFNCAEMLVKESYKLSQNAFWDADSANPEHIARVHKVTDARLGLSEFQHGVINQARLHELLLEGMADAAAQLKPHYSSRLLGLEIDDSLTQDLDAYPIRAEFDREDGRTTETIQARYVIGTDGGRSEVRKSLSVPLQGDSANKAWGVMDVLCVTNFPDIRVKCFIQSKEHGAMLVVPREGGYLVRLYVELDRLESDQRASSLSLGIDDMIARAQKVLNPYKLDVKEVAWWSIYEVGQRVAERFDNRLPEAEEHLIPRAFLAGDACHTHSPKGGWGLNTSLPDTFNLGWKLAAVLQGKSDPTLLQTYATERRKVARMLIDADREMAALVATRPAVKEGSEPTKTDTSDIQNFVSRHNGFIAGTSIEYDPSYLCTGQAHQHLATGFHIGQRFHSAPGIRLADGTRRHLGHLNKADGRWRLFLFANDQDPTDPSSDFGSLIAALNDQEQSTIHRYTPQGRDIDAVIDLFAVFQQADLAIETLPDLLWPAKGKYGLRDYEKVFHAEPGNDVFDLRGIDRQKGCMVVVRPDQHVAAVLPLVAHDELASFFAAFMIPQD